MKLQEMIEENERRKNELLAEYNPYTGEGSPLPRFPVVWEDDIIIYLPEPMKELEAIKEIMRYRSVKEHWQYCLSHMEWEVAKGHFNEMRCKHDFEFWAATCAKIKHKLTAATVNFVFNKPQREFVRRVELLRWAGKPVRLVVLKHRQWGCTTLSYTYIAWHQLELYKSRDAWFIGLDNSGGEDVVDRYKTIIKNYPREIRIARMGKSSNTQRLVQRDAGVSIGTVENPNAPSGRSPKYAHLFEVGKWPSNPTVNAENVTQNVESMVHDVEGSIVIQESTAKADTGTYFKSLCEKAERGLSSYEFLFVGWLTDNMLIYDKWRLDDEDNADERPIKGNEEAFVGSWKRMSLMDRDYCTYLWDMGATFQQIAWYQRQIRKAGYIVKGHFGLKEEYPTTSEEAFQSGANRVFPGKYMPAVKLMNREPIARGRLESDGDKIDGSVVEAKKVFENIRFIPDPLGPLSIYRWPWDDYGGLVEIDPETKKPVHKYIYRTVGALDLGGVWEKADYTSFRVLDRVPTTFGSPAEIVCEYHGHEETDKVAVDTARIAYWYHKAEFIPESNKFEQNPHKDEIAPDVTWTILDKLSDVYPNMYLRQAFDQARNQALTKVGFHMNKQTKGLVIDALKQALREIWEDHVNNVEERIRGYIEPGQEACDEFDSFLYQMDGKTMVMAAAAQKNDDRVISTALCIWRHSDLPSCRLVIPSPPKKRQRANTARF